MSPPAPSANLSRPIDTDVPARSAGVAWRICQGWEASVTGPTAPDWQHLESYAGAQRVKGGHGRETWRVKVGNDAVFAKIYRASGLREHLRRLVVGDPTRREWRAVRRANALGVSVVRPIAVGVTGSSTIYLSEAVEGGVVLPEAWRKATEDSVASARRQATGRVTAAVAELFANAHDRGFAHGDAHPNNILVRKDDRGGLQALFLDVHSAAFSRGPLSPTDALVGIAQLDQFFQRRATRGDRTRFLREYLSRRPGLGDGHGAAWSMRALLQTYRSVAARHASRLAHHRDRRLWRDGKYFTTLRLRGGWRATVVLDLERRHVFPEPTVPDRSAEDWAAILEPALARLTAGAAGTSEGSGILVEARPLPIGERIRALPGCNAERTQFERCHRDRHRDRPSPLVLAYLRRGFGWLPGIVGLAFPADLGDSGQAKKRDEHEQN